jgi:hypothetical protein
MACSGGAPVASDVAQVVDCKSKGTCLIAPASDTASEVVPQNDDGNYGGPAADVQEPIKPPRFQ